MEDACCLDLPRIHGDLKNFLRIGNGRYEISEYHLRRFRYLVLEHVYTEPHATLFPGGVGSQLGRFEYFLHSLPRLPSLKEVSIRKVHGNRKSRAQRFASLEIKDTPYAVMLASGVETISEKTEAYLAHLKVFHPTWKVPQIIFCQLLEG